MFNSNTYIVEECEFNTGFDKTDEMIPRISHIRMNPEIITYKCKVYPRSNLQSTFQFYVRPSSKIIISRLRSIRKSKVCTVSGERYYADKEIGEKIGVLAHLQLGDYSGTEPYGG